jgi:hypothetical protein
MFETSAGTLNFPVNVATSDNGGHSAETVAHLCVDRLIKVSDSAPPEIAAQARAFRQQMLEVVLQYVNLAVSEDRSTVANKLEHVGLSDIAQKIRSL